MIAIIDYGSGNLGSVAKAFTAIGAEVKVTSLSKDLDKAGKIVLPGVGAFADAMQSLKKLKIIPSLIGNIKAGKPYLGLCLGMQILFEESEEGGRHKGLGILKGKVKRFSFNSRTHELANSRTILKVPHIGWNTINLRHCERAESERSNPLTGRLRTLKKERLLRRPSPSLRSGLCGPPRNDGKCPLLKNIPNNAWMYFVHSYYAAPKDKTVIAATTDYGVEFASMVWKGNIYATQFHPEKSQAIGMKMLENFVKC